MTAGRREAIQFFERQKRTLKSKMGPRPFERGEFVRTGDFDGHTLVKAGFDRERWTRELERDLAQAMAGQKYGAKGAEVNAKYMIELVESELAHGKTIDEAQESALIQCFPWG